LSLEVEFLEVRSLEAGEVVRSSVVRSSIGKYKFHTDFENTANLVNKMPPIRSYSKKYYKIFTCGIVLHLSYICAFAKINVN
jgi:hypothetical protein